MLLGRDEKIHRHGRRQFDGVKCREVAITDIDQPVIALLPAQVQVKGKSIYGVPREPEVGQVLWVTKIFRTYA